MVSTCCPPPFNAMADKATDKRDSRQLVGLLTYNPGGSSLFKSFFLGCPPCARGTGQHLKESIVTVLEPFVVAEQYCGFCGDGVYVHCGVGPLLDKHFGRKGTFLHDLMHKAALVDKLLRNVKADHAIMFEWLNLLTQVSCIIDVVL